MSTGVRGVIVEVPAPPSAPAPRRRMAAGAWGPLIVAAVLFALAYSNGGYGLSSRTLLAVALWLGIFAAGVLGVLTRQRPPRAALAAGGLLAAFAAWTLLSTLWAPNPEAAVDEFNRVSLYLAVFVLAVAAAGRGGVARWLAGLQIAIVAVAVVALASRFFPSLFSTRGLNVFLPDSAMRLSFPIGYWNGLAALAALGIPLCLGAATAGRSHWARASSLAALPLLASAVYLTSSRGGGAAAALGLVVMLGGAAERWRLLAAGAAALPGTAVAVGWLATRHALVDGPLGSATARSEGRWSALVAVLACAVTAGLLFAGERLLAGVRRPTRRAGFGVVAAVAVALVAVAVLAHPVRRLESFRSLPQAQAGAGFTNAHLFSGNGSGRWQFWTAAAHEFTQAPLQGGGAGSYRYWWSQHASFRYTVRNAHSLYLEVLGELGVVGFILLAGTLVVATATGVRRIAAAAGPERTVMAALLGLVAAFLFSAALDWVWQLPTVAIPTVAALGLLTGRATPDIAQERPWPGRSRLAVGAAAGALTWALICAQAIPWLVATRISASQASVGSGNLAQAERDALDARKLAPWAASPYVQLALVDERRRDFAAARRHIAAAIVRDNADWAVWYLAARIEREAGDAAAAAHDLARARALNPLSPLFQR